jgi:hypothetical protein
MSYSITKNGKELDPNLYTIDIKNKTFSSKENGLVLDFSNEDGWIFKTLNNCTFKTLDNCTFKTLSSCTFNTTYNCTFNTGSYCTFNTGYSCTFKTGYHCTFYTLDNCTFKTLYSCTFKTESDCTYNCYKDLEIKLVKDSCILLKKDDKTEILDLNYFIEKNPSLEGFQIKINSKEDIELFSNLKTNNDFMLNLRKPNVKNFLDFVNMK